MPTTSTSEIIVHERRADFEEQMRLQRLNNRLTGRVLTRELILAITRAGAEFTAADFLFIASAGHTEKYEEERDTLATLASLTAGQMVGVVNTGRLTTVGVTDVNPMSLKISTSCASIDVDTSFHFDRTMEAGLKLAVWARSAKEDQSYPPHDIIARTSPASFVVLRSWHEPKHEFDNAFEGPSTLLVGSEALMAHALTGDEIGIKQIAECMTLLGSIASEGFQPKPA